MHAPGAVRDIPAQSPPVSGANRPRSQHGNSRTRHDAQSGWSRAGRVPGCPDLRPWVSRFAPIGGTGPSAEMRDTRSKASDRTQCDDKDHTSTFDHKRARVMRYGCARSQCRSSPALVIGGAESARRGSISSMPYPVGIPVALETTQEFIAPFARPRITERAGEPTRPPTAAYVARCPYLQSRSTTSTSSMSIVRIDYRVRSATGAARGTPRLQETTKRPK